MEVGCVEVNGRSARDISTVKVVAVVRPRFTYPDASRHLLLPYTENVTRCGMKTYQAKQDDPGRCEKASEDCRDELQRNFLLGAERVEDFRARLK